MPLKRYSDTAPVIWIVLCILLIYSVFNAVRHYNHSPYNDLRNRVVGARLMAAGQSPYFYKWQNGDPETWLDPFEKQNQVVNGNTVTPVTLFLFSGLNPVHFSNTQWLWVVVSFAFFLMSLELIRRLIFQYKKPEHGFLIPALLLAAAGWKMHLYSGQIYIVYSFLLLLFFYEYALKKFYAAGFIALLLVAMRPPFLLLFLPLFVFRFQRGMAWGSAVAIVLLVLVHFFWIPIHYWTDYFNSMRIHALEIPGQIPEIPVNTVVPANPEGIGFDHIAQEKYLAALSPDILSVQKVLPKSGFCAQTFVLPFLLLFVYLLLFAVTAKRKPLKQMDVTGLLLFGFALYILSEYFLPAPRFTYNVVQWLFPLGVLVSGRKLYPGWRLYLLLTGLLLNIIKLPFIPDSYSVGELLMLAAIVVYMAEPEKTGENKRPVSKFASTL